MSKLKELIEELCLNGVEYKELGEIATIYGGLTGKTKKDFGIGNAKFIPYMNIFNNLSIDLENLEQVEIKCDEKQNEVKQGDVLFTASSESREESGMASVLVEKYNEPLYLNSFSFGVRWNDNSLFEPGFTKYLFNSAEMRKQIIRTANGVTRYNVSKKLMVKIKVPIVPLEVQREIVRILDNFTELTAELIAELTAELTARKTQYEYYRDELLKNKSEKIEKTQIKNVVGKVSNIKWKDEQNGTYKYVDLSSIELETNRIGECEYITNEEHPSRAQQIINTDDILFATTRPMQKRLGIVEEHLNNQICSTGYCVLRADKNKVYPKWIYYNLSTENFYNYVERYQQGTSYPSITDKLVKDYEIAIPSMETQEHIIHVLDNFESIYSDLNIGLPAEIEARQKQYEFYRDKLLTFKKIEE